MNPAAQWSKRRQATDCAVLLRQLLMLFDLHRYSNAKAMAIVTAEIEIEDHESGNRWDMFYPVWARAEHRWYPSGRFHAYNEYVKQNIGELTMKYAPGVSIRRLHH